MFTPFMFLAWLNIIQSMETLAFIIKLSNMKVHVYTISDTHVGGMNTYIYNFIQMEVYYICSSFFNLSLAKKRRENEETLLVTEYC